MTFISIRGPGRSNAGGPSGRATLAAVHAAIKASDVRTVFLGVESWWPPNNRIAVAAICRIFIVRRTPKPNRFGNTQPYSMPQSRGLLLVIFTPGWTRGALAAYVAVTRMRFAAASAHL
jgi:hypothetical protein